MIDLMSSIEVFMNVADEEDFMDQQEQPPSLDCMGDVSVTTFNILAPIHKRLNCERESKFKERWLCRNRSILDRLIHQKSTIICLQEFWVGNEELVATYERPLNDAGYATYKLARTNNRGDGLLTAVQQDRFQVLNYKELLFNDFGDKVAQLLHIDLARNQTFNIKKEFLLVNTHLLFPHDSSYCLHRLQQAHKILQYIESYCEEYKLPHLPILLCGDWNGSKRGNVYKFLRSQGFVSSYDVAHHYTDKDVDCRKWVSHRNHRGDICGVDFIWLLNPNHPRKPLKESFMEAVLGNIKNLLGEISTNSNDYLNFFQTNFNHRTYITHPQFCEAFIRFGFTNHPYDGLSTEEIKDVWDYVDIDRDGVVDFSKFNDISQSPLDCAPSLPNNSEDEDTKVWGQTLQGKSKASTTIGFNVKNASLFPPEVEQGMWPENYFLSDHALLTVEFAPVMIHCL